MQTLLLVVCLLVAVVHPQPTLDSPHPSGRDLGLWELYKINYVKTYESEKEHIERRKIFLNNLAFVREHNAKFERGEVTFDVEINKFADLSSKEFVAKMTGLRIPANRTASRQVFQKPEGLKLPSTVDWRREGAVTGVKDQGGCGSCWAFSSTGSLEGQTFIKTRRLVSLSEQNLVDCSRGQGNQGCNGGWMDQAFLYIGLNDGIDTEASYPYEGREGPCRYNPNNRGATDYGYVDLSPGDENNLQAGVAIKGPIAVAINAGQQSFQLYKSGVYADPGCSPQELNHAVTLVGYGEASSGGDYWLVKNSWGTGWGMEGYMLMGRNRGNMCGIAAAPSFPIV